MTLRFEAAGTLGGFDGCNRYRGNYTVEGAALCISREIAATMMARPEPMTSRTYAGELRRTAFFAVDDRRLSLRDGMAEEVAGFEADGIRLGGTSWNVLNYNNGKQAVVSLIRGTRITADFANDGRVTGSAGCNRYFASYEIVAGSIRIGPAGATRKFCVHPQGLMDQEARYLEALRAATAFRIESEKLTLRIAGGTLAATLVREAPSRPIHGRPVCRTRSIRGPGSHMC